MFGHFKKDCRNPDSRSLSEKLDKKPHHKKSSRPSCLHLQNNSNYAHIVAANDISKQELFWSLKTYIAMAMQAQRGSWYMDLCAFKYVTNNKSLFIGKLQLKSLDFTIAGGQTL